MNSGIIEELSIKISSHLDPQEPKACIGIREEKVEMDNIMSNYKKDSEIQEKLKNVVIENYLEFKNSGKYEHRKC